MNHPYTKMMRIGAIYYAVVVEKEKELFKQQPDLGSSRQSTASKRKSGVSWDTENGVALLCHFSWFLYMWKG